MRLRPPFDRVTIEPGKLGGHPCIRGMRITVRRVLEILATYPDRRELFEDYPDLQEEDLQQALAFAAATVDGTIDLHIDPHEAGPPGLGLACAIRSGAPCGRMGCAACRR